MREQLTPLDAAFLEIEQADECSHMHIGWAMVFDPRLGGGTPSVEEVQTLLDRRLDATPAFESGSRIRVPAACAGRAGRRTPHFDIAGHVRHATLPAPGGDAELLDWMGDFYSHRLDRSRPLWEITLLDGLSDGRWSLFTKLRLKLASKAKRAVKRALRRKKRLKAKLSLVVTDNAGNAQTKKYSVRLKP